MKKSITFFKATLFLITLMSLVSCNKKEEISVLVNKLWFPEGACVQDLSVTANCKWSISIDDGADWFTIDPMSGRNNETLKVSVKALGELDSRSSSFTITSAKGTVQLKVLVSQNTDDPTELKSITNMVFGVASFAHWNVDYFGEVIEESYFHYEYNYTHRSLEYKNISLSNCLFYHSISGHQNQGFSLLLATQVRFLCYSLAPCIEGHGTVLLLKKEKIM